MKKVFWVAGLAAALSALPLTGANLVDNPGFETGDLSGWTTTPDGQWWINAWDATGPHSGTYYAGTGCRSFGCFLSQTLPTTSGSFYDFDFWYDSGPGTGTELQLKVYWDGTQIDNIVGNTGGYQHYNYFGLAATGTSAQISFEGLQDPSYNGVDDVSVEQSAIPEPASVGLFSLGVAAFVWKRRSHR